MGTPVERRLAAILSADAVGYSRLMSQDDEATVRAIDGHRRGIEAVIRRFRGRLVDAPGDNLLAEFPSVAGAVRCAIEAQRTFAAENAKQAEDRRMEFRIGIHLGDVIVEEPRIYGSGINIAARLEALAAPAAVCISDFVYQQVRGKLDLPVEDLGPQRFKNIDEPVHAYQIRLEPAPAPGLPERELELATPPDKPSLVVLPFANLCGDEAQAYFVHGLVEDILTELTRIPGLFVIGHDASNAYRKSGATPGDAARVVGVRYVLEGAARRAERRVRVTARLIDVQTGASVWSERYDRLLEDVFAVQDEIVSEVVTALDVKLVSGPGGFETRKHLRNPQAIGLLYRGTDLMHRFNREDLREARALFEEVIRMEPKSPIAYISASWSYYFEVQRGWTDDPGAALQEMTRLLERALELGDVSGFAALMMSHVHLMRREYDAALEVSERAVAERPSCQGAYSLRANILNFTGSPDEAIPLAKLAIRLSPVAHTFYPEVLAHAYYLSEHYEEAIEAGHQSLRLAPDCFEARVFLIAALVETGRVEAARQMVPEILALEPSLTLASIASSQPYRDSRARDRLLGSLREAGLPEGDLSDLSSLEGSIAAPRTASRRRVLPMARRT